MRAALRVTIPTGPALIVGAVAIAAGIVLATILALRPRSESPGLSPSASASGPAPPATVAAVPTPAETAAAPSTTIATEEPALSATTAVSPARPAARPTFPVGPAVAPVAKPRANCDPPYVYDVDGVKHYKRECN
jgi:hypothetical protein